jgi:hypothetical protein
LISAYQGPRARTPLFDETVCAASHKKLEGIVWKRADAAYAPGNTAYVKSSPAASCGRRWGEKDVPL